VEDNDIMRVLTINKDALQLAHQTLQAQPFVPNSPGQQHQGKMLFCAGAACAAAGLLLREGNQAVEDFSQRLIKFGSSEIAKTFQHLGWSSDEAWQVVGWNDSATPDTRAALLAPLAA
jgi:hypothetical protein